MEKRAPTPTATVLLGRHLSTPGDTVLTVPLTEVIRPVEPEGIDMTMSRTVPARVTVARYTKVVVPFEATEGVMVTLAPAADAGPAANVTMADNMRTTLADAINLRIIISPGIRTAQKQV